MLKQGRKACAAEAEGATEEVATKDSEEEIGKAGKETGEVAGDDIPASQDSNQSTTPKILRQNP